MEMESDQNNSKRRRKEEGEEEEPVRKDLSAAAVAVAVAHLPEEVIENILVRLPVKSLLRFKSVHKLWRSLISDPHFVKQHHNTVTASRRICAVLLSRPSCVSLTTVDLNSPPDDDDDDDEVVVGKARLHFPLSDEKLFIVGSANGLLLVCNSHAVFLWNPCTGEYKKFPRVSRNLMTHIIREPVIGGGSQISGFGYDSTTDEYKAVIIVNHKLTSKTGHWTGSDDIHAFPYFTGNTSPGVTVNNGAPHWIVQLHRHCHDGNRELALLFFDWADERLKEVPLPDSLLIKTDSFDLDLADFGGCISIVDSSRDSSIDVWVMKEHGVKDSWTKLFVIPKLDPNDYFIPLGFAKDGEEVLLLVNNQRLVSYNLKTGAEILLSSVRERPLKHGKAQWLFDLAICMQSLISPNVAEAAVH